MARPEEEFTVSEDALQPEERDIETPASDAVEQATLANPAENEVEEVHRGLEVNEWDAVEQARVVDLDDDYR
jgi:hypothetical protein